MNENKERLSTNPVSKMFEGYETKANEYKSFLSVLVEDREEKARIEGTETDRVMCPHHNSKIVNLQKFQEMSLQGGEVHVSTEKSLTEALDPLY